MFRLVSRVRGTSPAASVLRHDIRRGSNFSSESASAIPELVGTAPWHRYSVYLHTAMPPSEYPCKMTSTVYRELLLRTRAEGGLVNFSWSPTQSTSNGPQSFAASAFFPTGHYLSIPRIDISNVEDVATMLNGQGVPSGSTLDGRDIRIFVCTHGARDCRCGSTGSQVAAALRAEASRRPESDRIHVAETAHVGGHKYAANVIVYPRGEWLGLVTIDDVPSVLDAIIGNCSRPHALDAAPMLPRHWRGRMGLDKAEQIELFDRSLCTPPPSS